MSDWRPLQVIEQDTVNFPFGTVVQEIHHPDDACIEPNCDYYAPLWEMGFQVGWCRAGCMYDHTDDSPRMPVRLLWHPEWSDH